MNYLKKEKYVVNFIVVLEMGECTSFNRYLNLQLLKSK